MNAPLNDLVDAINNAHYVGYPVTADQVESIAINYESAQDEQVMYGEIQRYASPTAIEVQVYLKDSRYGIDLKDAEVGLVLSHMAASVFGVSAGHR